MKTYQVVSGDTLTRIAARFGTSVETLVKLNGLANPDFIRVGQVLTIEKTKQPEAAKPNQDKTLPELLEAAMAAIDQLPEVKQLLEVLK